MVFFWFSVTYLGILQGSTLNCQADLQEPRKTPFGKWHDNHIVFQSQIGNRQC